MAEENVPVAAVEQPAKEKKDSTVKDIEAKLLKEEVKTLKDTYTSQRNLTAVITHTNKYEEVEKAKKKYEELVKACDKALARLKTKKIADLKKGIAAMNEELKKLEAPAEGEGV